MTFFVNVNSGATICHGVPHKPCQFVDSHASLNVCLVQLLSRELQKCSCSILMTNEDSLSHAACKRTDTVFSNFTKPNFLSNLRCWLFSIFDQFSSFHPSFHPCQFSSCSRLALQNEEANGVMDCHLRYVHLCSVQRKFEEFYTVVSLFSQPFPHDHWPSPCGITSTPTHA